MSNIDTIDKKIVDLLFEDGRMSCTNIAQRIGDISERSVRYRINRLIKQGIIHITPVVSPQAIGYLVLADVSVETEPNCLMEVANKIAKHQLVCYVACTTGDRDLNIQVLAHNNSELYSFVTEVIGKIPGVRKTTTSIIPLTLKDVHQWHIQSLADENIPDK